jgi:hypothetical protein
MPIPRTGQDLLATIPFQILGYHLRHPTPHSVPPKESAIRTQGVYIIVIGASYNLSLSISLQVSQGNSVDPRSGGVPPKKMTSPIEKVDVLVLGARY